MALKSGRVGIHPSQVDPITGMLLSSPGGASDLSDLDDVSIDNPEVGQQLIYDGNKWENQFASISPLSLAQLRDVVITDLQDGDFITYDLTSEKWVNTGETPGPTYTDLTVTMYGAVEDTISFTDAAGISHSEVFASGQSSKSVTFKINPSGSTPITFTSAVAKNPDDLTADYSKSVTITSATTEIKIMPDNVSYWYGYNADNIELTSSENGYTVSTGSASFNGTFTKNKNNISLATSSGGNLYGIADKIARTGKTTAILQAVGSDMGADSYYGRLGNITNKSVNYSTLADISNIRAITTDTLQKFQIVSSVTNYNTVAWMYGGQAVNIYALWYE